MPVIDKEFSNHDLVISLIKELDIIPKYFPKKELNVSSKKKIKNFVNTCNKNQLMLALATELNTKLKGDELNDRIAELVGHNFAQESFKSNVRQDIAKSDTAKNLVGVLEGLTKRVDNLTQRQDKVSCGDNTDRLLDSMLSANGWALGESSLSALEKLTLALTYVKSSISLTAREKEELKQIMPDSVVENGLVEVVKYLAYNDVRKTNNYLVDSIEQDRVFNLCDQLGVNYVDFDTKLHNILVVIVDEMYKKHDTELSAICGMAMESARKTYENSCEVRELNKQMKDLDTFCDELSEKFNTLHFSTNNEAHFLRSLLSESETHTDEQLNRLEKRMDKLDDIIDEKEDHILSRIEYMEEKQMITSSQRDMSTKNYDKIIEMGQEVHSLEDRVLEVQRIQSSNKTFMLTGLCFFALAFFITLVSVKKPITPEVQIKTESSLLDKYELPDWRFTHYDTTVYIYKLKDKQFRCFAVNKKGIIVRDYLSINDCVDDCVRSYKEDERRGISSRK